MTVHPAEEKEKKDDEDYDNDEQKDEEDEGEEKDEEEEDEPFRVDEVPEHEREELRAQLVAQQDERSVIEPEPDAEDEEQSEIAGLKKQIAALEEKAALGLSSRAVKALNPPWWSEHESFLPEHLLRPPCKINPGLNPAPGENAVRCVILLFVLTSL